MKRPIVFFDFDGMVMQTWEPFREFARAYYGVEMPAEFDFNGTALLNAINAARPQDKQVSSDQFYEDNTNHFLASHKYHMSAKPVVGAEKVIPLLAQGQDLWIVTARQDVSKPVIEALCQQYFWGCFSGVYCVWHRNGVRQFSCNGSKKDFIFGYDGEKVAFFDDSPHEIEQVRSVIPAYLFDPNDRHAENHEYCDSRVRSWEDIADLLL